MYSLFLRFYILVYYIMIHMNIDILFISSQSRICYTKPGSLPARGDFR